MMRITHIAIWVDHLDAMRQFYETYFGASSGEKYVNPQKQYSSHFLTFADGGCKIELMHRPDMLENVSERGRIKGWAHIAVAVGSVQRVDELTLRLRSDGFSIQGEPRTTGDGFYESIVLDPEGNWVEITDQ